MIQSSKQKTVCIFNPRNQPVELHFDNQCIVVQPKQQVECSGLIVEAPQIRYLLLKRYLLVRPANHQKTSAGKQNVVPASEEEPGHEKVKKKAVAEVKKKTAQHVKKSVTKERSNNTTAKSKKKSHAHAQKRKARDRKP